MTPILHIRRRKTPRRRGAFARYELGGITPDMSFPEMLDVLNQQLASEGGSPIAFESDCREGICGACGFMIDGVAHGPLAGTAVCQLHGGHYADAAELTIEPWRARAFPVPKDLVVERSAFDRVIVAGGFIAAPTGPAPEASVSLVPKRCADEALDAAICVGCGACVAACPNASASLFTGGEDRPSGTPSARAA